MSRLQTAALLQSGVFTAWYALKPKADLIPVKNGLLLTGFLVSVFIISIMVRDGQYMEVLKSRAGVIFPYTGKDAPKGRGCGLFIVVILAAADIALFFI